jgi:hypothetical protein
VVAFLLLAAAPLGVSLLLYGHQRWTAQWTEALVAYGCLAPRFPWNEEVFMTRPTEMDKAQPLALERLFLSTDDGGDAELARRLHGLCLILGERREPFGFDPAKLIWWSELSRDGRRLFAESWDFERFDPRLRTALSNAPHDMLLEADLIFGARSTWWRVAERAESQAQIVPEPADRIDSAAETDVEFSGPPEVGELWGLLAHATRVLKHNAAPQSPHVIVAWIQWGNAPSMYGGFAWRTESVPLTKWCDDEYFRAMESLSRSRAAEHLERPLEDRVQRVWEALGLEPRTATYAARNGRSSAALAVGRQCALHLELMEKLVTDAFEHDDLEHAARWVELLEGVSAVLENSVKSPWVYNYVQKKHCGAGGYAQLVRGHPACPTDVAVRMAAIMSRTPTVTPRSAPPSRATLAAFCLDNFARSSLRIAAATLLAALIGAVHLRKRRHSSIHAGAVIGTRRAPVVAAAACAIVAAAFAVLEASNLLGKHVASWSYVSVLVAIVVAIALFLVWLTISLLIRDQLRRRVAWLVGFMLVLAAMRPLVGLDSPGVGISVQLRLFLGALLAATSITYAAVRWHRARRDPHVTPAIHPLVLGALSLWFSLWIVTGPPGERLRGPQQAWLDFGNESSAIMEQVEPLAYLFQGPNVASPAHGLGFYLLALSIAARMIHFGLWFILACVALWLIVNRGAKVGRAAGTADAGEQAGPVCLTGVTWSCLWMGLVSLAIHAWCTLGAGYCFCRVLSHGVG